MKRLLLVALFGVAACSPVCAPPTRIISPTVVVAPAERCWQVVYAAPHVGSRIGTLDPPPVTYLEVPC